MNKIDKLSKSIINELKSNANEKSRISMKYYFKEPNVLNNIGLTLTAMKDTIKKFQPDVKELSADEILEVSDKLARSNIDEAIHFAFHILKNTEKKNDKKKVFALLQSWLDDNLLQNWALIDLASSYFLSYCMEDMPAIRAELFKYSDSEILWHRRISIVGYVSHAKKGKYLDEFYKTAEKLCTNKEDLMQKAVGWILRNAGDADKARLIKFLNKNGKSMGRTAIRYAIEHFPEAERKAMLLSTK